MTYKNTWCSDDAIVAYGKHIDIAFTKGDVEEMLAYAKEWEVVDTKTLVWEFLDTYEGISHTRDPEFFKNEGKVA
jgi:DNA polymerase III alpha subunit (gram-positive type)